MCLWHLPHTRETCASDTAHPGQGGTMHKHNHAPAPSPANRTRLALALGITMTVMMAETLGALLTGSLSLLTDAAHMLNDAAGLAVALVAAHLMLRPPCPKRTWGWLRLEVLAAGVQAGILGLVGIYAFLEGSIRMIAPEPVAPIPMLIVGTVGLIANLASLAILHQGRKDNLNMKAAFLEVAADALGSIAVILSAGTIYFTGWERADALAGLLIVTLILPRTWHLLRESGSILLESTPPNLDLEKVREHMLELSHVEGVHDVHASMVTSSLPTLTAHVVLSDECFQDGHALQTLHELQQCLRQHHGLAIHHTTLQLENATQAQLHLDSTHA